MVQVRVVFSLALITLFLVLSGCSGGTVPDRPIGQEAPGIGLDLQQALTQLEALPTPEGVDVATFATLKAALRKLLIERQASKFVSVAPGSARSKVKDLIVAADGAGARFHWSYRNEGDFSQDSLVGVGDLTPLGIHWGKDSSAPDWATARVADGNENTKVEIGDLVSIGANFMYRVTGYALERGDTADPGGVWTKKADIAFATSFVPAGQLRQFSYLLSSPEIGYYRVVPYDGALAGIPSDPVLWLGLPSGDWPMFGHDVQRTRRSPFVGAATNAQKWSFSAGAEIVSSPAISLSGTVYVGCNDDKLYAINADGSLNWTYTTGGEVYSSPAIGPTGTVYVASWDGKLYAILPDGSLKWAYDTGSLVSTSPAIGADGALYVGSDKLYAITADGVLKWSYTPGDLVAYSSPALGTDGTVYVGNDDAKLYAITPNGNLKWTFATGTSSVYSSPAVGADGTIYVGSSDPSFKLFAINPDGTLRWSRATENYVQSSPAIATDGTVYVGSHDGKLYAIKPDAEIKWTYTTGGGVESSPAIDAAGTVYVGSRDSNLYAINPDGSLRWSFTAGSQVNSSPAIGVDGTVYVGCIDFKLYAIGP